MVKMSLPPSSSSKRPLAIHGVIAAPLLLCASTIVMYILLTISRSEPPSLINVTTLTQCHYILGVCTIAAATLLTAPYGRHASKSTQWTVSPFVAWVCQEVPTLLAVGVVLLPGLVWWIPETREVLGAGRGTILRALDAAVEAAVAASSTSSNNSNDGTSAAVVANAIVSPLKKLVNFVFLDWLNPKLLTTSAAIFYPSILLFIIHYIHRTFIYPNFLGKSPNRVPWYVTLLASVYCSFNGVLQTMVNSVGTHDSRLSRQLAYEHIVSTPGMATSLQRMAKPGGSASPQQGGSGSGGGEWMTVVQAHISSLFGEMMGFNHIALPVWFWGGVGLFFVGMGVNMYCDYYILGLRKTSATKQTHTTTSKLVAPKSSYVIPMTIFHQFVSCPNFAAEIVEWVGYSIAVYGASGMYMPFIAAFSFPVYTLCNLGPRAVQHHRWYLEHFGEDYRRLNRKALVPFLV